MKIPVKRSHVLLVLAAALSACAPVAVRRDEAGLLAALERHETQVRAMPDWSFKGRLALSHAGEGGSGGIEWQQHGADFDIRMVAPVTRQSWRLVRVAGSVRLEGLEGGPQVGDDAEALLLEATGWQVPIHALADWLRGARSPGEASVEFAPGGRLASLRQQGWTVEFKAWEAQAPGRPLKIFARRGDASVRLVIDRWDSP